MVKPSPPSYPSHYQMLKNLLVEAYETANQGLCGDRVIASRSSVKERLEICATCDKFDAAAKRCTVCGCFMMVKANLEASTCPDGKW
ncbi:hypothetical protein NIES4073_27860 [Kalymmatonema gypsitolerans NIES-4073]|uniref:hypothetical protein n=1 Tax=Scytonema sp. PRP1 TaxID=3120513 RepID=UPI000B5E1684|nr:hypothetical protein NIES4073_27860 [Scytonema sp. NIES-4073]